MKKLNYQPNDSGIVYLWALCLPIILSLAISFILAISGAEVVKEGDSSYFAITKETWFIAVLRLLSAGLLVGLFLIFNKKKNVAGMYASGLNTHANYLNIAFCAVLGIGVCYLLSPFITIIQYLFSLMGISIQTGIDMPLSTFGDYVLALVLIALLPAVTEELVYRGMIFQGLKSFGKWPAILLSATAFSLMHGNIPQLPYTFILGIILGYVMWQTKALWLCMILHFFNNATVLTSMYIANTKGESSSLPTSISTADVFIALALLFVAVAFVVLIFYLINKTNKKYPPWQKQIEGEECTAQNKNKDTMLLVIGFVVAVVFVIIQTI